MKTRFIIILCSFLVLSCSNVKNEQNWPQFRGLNGSGVASESSIPPVTFDDIKPAWRLQISPGSSSPVIWDNKLFITSFIKEKKELQTICINREKGKILWTANVQPDTIEKYHSVSSPAMATVATDGIHVVTFFGSCGLFCYDMDGSLLWKYPMPCSKDYYGNGASPVISNDKIIFLHDQSQGRYLLALDKNTGTEVWKTNLEDLQIPSIGSHSIPVIKDSLIFIHRSGEIACFSLTDGSPIWNFKLLTAGITTPIISGDNLVTACWYNFSEKEQRGEMPDFDTLLEKYDKDKNGKISYQEAPGDILLYFRPEAGGLEGTSQSIKSYFRAFDINRDQSITRQEWQLDLDYLNNFFYKPAGLIAIKLNSKGQLFEKDIQWRVLNDTPEVPSPIYDKNHIYMIKDGGTLTCADSETGKVFYQERIGNPGPHFASPVAANGFVYLFSYNGKLKVVKEVDTLEIASEYDFKDKITATPAIAGNNIYIRTSKELLAFK